MLSMPIRPRTILTLGLAACGLFGATACKSSWNASNGAQTSQTTTTTSTRKAEPLAEQKTVAALNARYIVGPTPSRELGMRISWQQDVPLDGSTGIKSLWMAGSDVLAVDGRNRLTLLRASDGNQVWHAVPLPPQEAVLGVNRLTMPRGHDRIFLTTDTDLFEIDANTGHLITRQNMLRIPDTGVSQFGTNLIFGCSDGRIIWHNVTVGHEMQANKLNSGIAATPQLVGTDVVVVSEKGEVMMLDAITSKRIWQYNLPAGISAAPAASELGVFVAGLGQSLWSLNERDGSVNWKYFTESPLTTGPTLFSDRVFQFVPTEGLVCFDAVSAGKLNGTVLWRVNGLSGEIITVIGNDLVLWDSNARMLRLVEATRGGIRAEVHLPQAAGVQAFRPDGRNLVFLTWSDDGRIERLIPNNI